MTDSNPFDWTAKPESLEAKFKLMCRLPYDPRVRRRHVLVFGFIIDWYHSKYGDALASVRHVHRMVQERDPAGKGLYIGEIHGALADLVSWGYLSQDKGKGRRASRYIPMWTVLEPSVQESPNATDNVRSVLESPNTSVLNSPNATGCSVLKSLNEDPSTMTRSLDPGTWMDELDCAAPTAPLSAGLTPADAEAAQEESDTVPNDPAKWFDHLYGVYGVRKGKAAARRAFDKIAPDRPAFIAMVAAAREWRSAAGGIDRKWLATWLTDECFDEEPSGPRTDRPAKAKPTSPAKPRKPASPFPFGETRLTITHAHEVKGETFERVVLTLTDNDGKEIEHSVFNQHHREETQIAGQKELDQIVPAAGFYFGPPDNVEELIGRTVVAVVDDHGLTWCPPDGGQVKPAPRGKTIDEEQADFDAWFEATQLEQ